MTKLTYAEAMLDAIDHSMAGDERVSMIGGTLFGLGPQRGLVDRLHADYPGRISNPPTSESACVAMGIGAAMAGERPLVDVGTASFLFEAWSQIVNEAAPAHYMSGGQIRVPVVFHMLHGLRGGGAAQHSHSPQGMLWNAPGLEIALPSSPADVKGLMRSALLSDNPTVFINHSLLLAVEEDVPDDDYDLPFGVADIKRAGRDATVVATSYQVLNALNAADTLTGEGIEVEVLDLRTVVPLDSAAVLDSVARTGRLVVADEANISCGIASEIAALVAEQGFASLKAPIRRITRPDVPVPFSPPLEAAITPTGDRIAAAVRALLA